jgi:hypothetical protein
MCLTGRQNPTRSTPSRSGSSIMYQCCSGKHLMHTSPPARKNLPNRRARGRGRKGSGRDDRSCQRRARRPTRTHPPGQATTPHRRRPATGRADQDCPYVCDLTAGGDQARQEQEPAPCTSTTNCPKKLSFVNPGRPSAQIDHSWDDLAACMRSVVARSWPWRRRACPRPGPIESFTSPPACLCRPLCVGVGGGACMYV